MKIEENETADEIIEKSVRIIETIEDKSLRGDSLAAMPTMSEDKYSSHLIRKYVRREMLMNSPLYKEWIAEDLEEASKQTSRDMIISLLETKFDLIPSSINEKLQVIDDLSILKSLNKKILTVSSIEEFEKFIERAEKLK